MNFYKDSDRPLNYDPYDYHVQNGIKHRVIENGYTWFNCVYINPSQSNHYKMISEKRQKALSWWSTLTDEEKENFFDGYKLYTLATDHTQLTGREIQNIWAVQTNKQS